MNDILSTSLVRDLIREAVKSLLIPIGLSVVAFATIEVTYYKFGGVGAMTVALFALPGFIMGLRHATQLRRTQGLAVNSAWQIRHIKYVLGTLTVGLILTVIGSMVIHYSSIP